MLSLNLRSIRSPHEHLERVYRPEVIEAELETDADAFRIVEPVSLAFDIRKSNEQFQLTGRVRTTLELPCSRCLEPLTSPVDAEFDLRYHPRTTTAGGDERQVDEADFSSASYENEEIDLGQLIRERLYLSLPMKPLCREDCLGLCPDCGTNLNRGTCDCTRTWEDPRFAALKALKKDS
jgi:DUF177 domain-containing protein